MRAADRHGRIPRRWKKTTIPDPDAPTRPDLIGRDFGIDLDQPGQLDRRRCGDITYIHTWQGWLYLALLDRYDGMWVLAATTGMRRSELAGVERQGVDLENGVLMIEDTRVVVAGRAQASDGKSEASQREISLDAFTVRHLKRFIDQMNQERKDFGRRYPNHDYLMAGPEGRPLHPDTITARFNRLVDRAGVPRIRLHDVRHTYATLAQDAGHNIKTLSERIGHADVTVTGKIYTHKSRGTDRVMADAMGAMIERLAAQNEASETGRGSEVG